jgi:hypothetical protein
MDADDVTAIPRILRRFHSAPHLARFENLSALQTLHRPVRVRSDLDLADRVIGQINRQAFVGGNFLVHRSPFAKTKIATLHADGDFNGCLSAIGEPI